MTERSTDLIRRYYRESDPIKRKKILEKSIEQGEEPEKNAVRKELWELRYQEASRAAKGNRSDGFLRLWMTLKYAQENTGGFLGGAKRSAKEVRKMLDKLGVSRMQEKGGIYEECLYDECVHAAELYIQSCETDKNYGTGLMGLMALSQEKIQSKITQDIYGVAISTPESLGLVDELSLISRSAKEVYQKHYPADEFEEAGEYRKKLLQ